MDAQADKPYEGHPAETPGDSRLEGSQQQRAGFSLRIVTTGVTVFVLLALHTWANLSFQVRSLENLEPRVETALAMCGQKQQEKIADATEAQAVTDWINDNLSDILNDADHDVKDAQRRINSVKAKEKAKAKAGTEEAGDHSDDHHDDDDMED